MRRRLATVVLALGLLLPVGIAQADTTQASVQPPGSCSYAAGFAQVSMSAVEPTPNQLLGSQWLLQGSAAIASPASCIFLISGRLAVTVYGPHKTSTASLWCPIGFTNPDGVPIIGGQSCNAIGTMSPFAAVEWTLTFNATIAAVEDGVSQSVQCSAYQLLQPPFQFGCYFADPTSLHTL